MGGCPPCSPPPPSPIPLPSDIPRLPFSRPHVHRARARVSRSPCLVRQVSRASSCSTKCSLADPNFSSLPLLPLRSAERNHYDPPAELMSPSTSIHARETIYSKFIIYAKNYTSVIVPRCSYMTLLVLDISYSIKKGND